MYFASLLIFTLGLISSASSLDVYGNLTYGIDLPRRCPRPFLSRCCRTNARCRMQYTLFGKWRNSVDTKPTALLCNRYCSKHYEMCRDGCICVTSVSEKESSKTCKCLRRFHPRINPRKVCLEVCRKARADCLSNCTSSKRCPLVAETEAKFIYYVPGKCKTICDPKVCRGPGPVIQNPSIDTKELPEPELN